MNRNITKIILAVFITSLTTNLMAQNSREFSAHRVADKFEKLDLTKLPSWSKADHRKHFRELRDKKFLSYDGEKTRIPWLYVRDGCHMRATHFIEEAVRQGLTKPKKIFIFGSLEMKGNIIPHGSVEPWFHAAPIVQVEGEAVVLDPSVSFSRPLPLAVWADRIVKDKSKVIYSICESETYLPTSHCTEPAPLDRKRLDEETQLFLKFERNILKYIGLGFVD
jgi:hypothetical protein